MVFIAPPRQMSSGSVPGSSGENMIFYLLAGVAAFGGLFYVSVGEWSCLCFRSWHGRRCVPGYRIWSRTVNRVWMS